MDPITLITTALIVGATAALQETAGQAVKDAYAGLKTLIVSRFQATKTAVTALEEKPSDPGAQDFVKARVTSAQANGDPDVLKEAKALLKLIKTQAPELGRVVGIKFEDFDFDAGLDIDTVKSAGDGVVVARGRAKAPVVIKNVDAGLSGNSDPNA